MIFTFDPPETGWSLNANAAIVADGTAPTQPNALRLIVTPSFSSTCLRTLSGLTPGSVYHATAQMRFDALDAPIGGAWFEYNNASGGAPGLLSYQSANPASPGGWELRDLGFLDYTYPDRTFAIRSFAPPNSSGLLYIDLISFLELGPMARSRWLAHQRLVAVLKGINGAGGGYHTDLGSRVFTKYIRPVGSTHPALPYLCVPLVNSNPRVEHEATRIKHTWTLPIMAFVAETNVGAYDSNAIAALYHLGEDVYKAVMQDPTLNGTVAPVSFVSGGVEEGGISPFDGLPYADAVIPIELSIFLGLDVLGP